MNITRKLFLFATTILLAGANHVLATPIMTFAGGSTGATLSSVNGWEFEVTSSIQVDGLGFWDFGSDGLTQAHDVGLWTLSGTLLASATVDNTSTPEANGAGPGQWLFTSISALALNPGNYVLGATYVLSTPNDRLAHGSGVLLVPGVNYVSSRQQSGSSLAFPTTVLGTNPQNAGMFGPNLRLAEAEAPLPGTLPILSLGLAALGLHRRRPSYR